LTLERSKDSSAARMSALRFAFVKPRRFSSSTFASSAARSSL
jgi:hypothetical protein